MAIIQNKATENGDVLIIKSETPIIGLVALLDFLDDTSDETVNRYFTKQFRYSIDGINYTPFIELTVDNLSTIEINSTDTFFVEYRYKREGGDTTGEIGFNYVELEGEYVYQEVGRAWSESNFSQYLDYNSICTIGWSVAVLEKLYRQGILPKYIERGLSNSNTEDRDFIDFWRSITHYYGWYVCLARYYKTFYSDPDLLIEYLVQRGAFICTDGEFDQTASLYLMNNFLDEMRQRGTVQIVREKTHIFTEGDSSVSQSVSNSNSDSITPTDPAEVKQIDGEYLRLICYNTLIDDFIFNLNRNENIGWNIGNSSPLYIGTQKFNDINKYHVDDINFLTDFTFYNNGDVGIEYVSHQEKDVLNIYNVTNGQVEGIGSYDEDLLIKVNPNIDYEISFMVRQDVNVNNISFGCFGYDINGTQINLLNAESQLDNNYFFEEQSLNNTRYHLVRGILYSSDKFKVFDSSSKYTVNQIVRIGSDYYKAIRNVDYDSVITDETKWLLISNSEEERMLKTNLHLGNNLQFKESIIKILPYIVLDNSNNVGGELFIHSIKVSPINNKYSVGFIQTPNILEIWNVNRNRSLSTSKIEENAKKYLFPYNVNPIWNWVSEPNITATIESNYLVLVEPEGDLPVIDPETGDLIFVLE